MPLDRSVVRIGEFRSVVLSVCPDVAYIVLDPAVYRSLTGGNFELSNS